MQALTRIEGVAAAFDAPRFHEAVLTLDRPAAPVLAALAAHGIAGGLDLGASFPELGPSLLVCATETKTDADIDSYARALAAAMHARTRRRRTRRAAPGEPPMLKLREPLIFELGKPGRQAPTQFPPVPEAGGASAGDSGALAPRGAARAARGVGASGRAPFHAPVAAQFLDRLAFLSLGLMHHEIQPQGVQHLRDAARVS